MLEPFVSRLAASIAAVIVACVAATAAFSQSYPSKPVRILTSVPGAGNDFIARLLAAEMTRTLGQQVVIDNRGASLAIEAAARAPADGYTLLLYGTAVWTSPFMRDNLPWDPKKDFIAIALCADSPNVLVVHPSLPVKTVRQLIALAKAKPRALNYGAGTIGSSPHLAAELFKSMAGIDMVRIAYRGTGPAVVALVAGEVHLVFAGAGAASPHMQSGKLRALAVASEKPSALAPGVPTVASAGVPGYEASSRAGMFAPAKTPDTVINRLNTDILQALAKAEVKQRMFAAGIETVGSSPAEFAALIDREMAKWGPLIRKAGLREE